jgi:hypothetical protein
MFVQIVFAAEFKLETLDSKEYTTGDIIRFKVENLKYDKALKLKNSRVTNLIYVLNVFKKDYDVYFEAILSEDKNFLEKEDSFIIEGLNYKSVKLNLSKEIDVIDSRIVLIKDKVIIIVSLFSMFIFILFILNLYFKRRKRRKIIILKKEKLNVNNEDISREHFEVFYLSRKDFKSLYTYDQESYNEFEAGLNSIQYKKYWSEEEYENIANKYKNLIVSAKDKNGI